MRKLHELEALLESSDTLSPITLGTNRKRINLFFNFSSFRTYSLMVFNLFGLHVHSFTHWLRPPPPPPPPHRIWAHIRGRYWSAKINDIFL
jgi:hypothetical protein